MSKATTQKAAAGQPIPMSADFPVVWDDPGEAKLTWMLNSAIDDPVPVMVDALSTIFLEGGNGSFDQVALPFNVRLKRINTYQYLGMVPASGPSDMVVKGMSLFNRAAPGMFKKLMNKMAAGMTSETEAALEALIARYEPYWHDELLPEIKQHIAYFESCDLRGMSQHQLRACLAETLKRVERMGALHGFALLTMLYGLSQFEEFYRELFPGSTTLDALRLTQGLENKTLEGDRALWRVSRAARSAPEVLAILNSKTADAVIPALEEAPAGRSFLVELRAWLDQYGQRLNSAFSFTEPSWIDDPAPAIRALQTYVSQPEARSELDPATMTADREQAIAEARAKLAAYPQPVIDRFEMLLSAAQVATIVHEDHNFWIDQRLMYHVQRLILELGRRNVEAGILDAAGDMFHLKPDELQNGQSPAFRQLIRERKAELARFSQVTPAPMLGTMPLFEMTDGGSVLRAIFKGELSPANDSRPAHNQVKGLAGSAGVTRGPARVLHSLAEADKLQPGDVLITASTEPPWTPLFATAAAVVTDAGGVLSHTAVVAREYRIPAVVGTGLATSTFRDGQLVEVDGDAGTVRVIMEETADEPTLVR